MVDKCPVCGSVYWVIESQPESICYVCYEWYRVEQRNWNFREVQRLESFYAGKTWGKQKHETR